MTKSCEACEHDVLAQSAGGTNPPLRNVLVGTRIVRLCDAHAQIALEDHIADIETLRRTVRVTGERRSPLERRNPLDRRVFPPRPEGRRRDAQRRHDD
jgi:hypothetical protein